MNKKKFSEIELLLGLNYSTEQPRILVDVGGHVGSSSRPFAEQGWRVVAFEPEPENYREFCLNFQNEPNVTCLQKAVSNVSGQQVPFYTSSEHWGIHSLKPFHPTHQPTMYVETVRLDDTLASLKITDVTLLKIDVEGADFLALKSFDFERLRPQAVMCEFMDERSQTNFGYTHHDMAEYMMQRGYVPYVSEWAPVVEYGRKNIPAATPHRFLQCVQYPLDHEPAWGNLIFIPQNRVAQFEQLLTRYLQWLAQDPAIETARQQYLKKCLRQSNLHLTGFKNKHQGQRCVIIGNGPSLNKMDLSFLRNEFTFGTNRIYLGFEKWGFSPTYYVSVNPLVIEQSIDEILKIPAPKFLALNGLPYVPEPEHKNIIFLRSIGAPHFSMDPRNGLWEGYTVTYVAMQLAFFMGFQEAVLIGVDHNFVTPGPANKEIVSQGGDPNHFHSDYFGHGVRWNLPDLPNSEVAYRLAQKNYVDAGRLIIDATVDGKLTIFPKVNYKNIFFVHNYEDQLLRLQKRLDADPNDIEAWTSVASIAQEIGDQLTYRAVSKRIQALQVVAVSRPQPGVPRESTPVLIFQMGKVGSSSVYESLKSLNLETSIFHVHYLSQSGIERVERSNPGQIPRHVIESRHLRNILDKGNFDSKWKIISLVREPIARNISAFFENINKRYPNFYPQYRGGTLDMETVINDFIENYSHDIPLTWFDLEMKTVFGIDVYSTKFRTSRGYEIFSGEYAHLLVIRLENLDKCASEAFKEFLQIDEFPLLKTNLSRDKEYYRVYQEFIDSINLPETYLEQMYNSKYARNFYTVTELDGFRAKWLNLSRENSATATDTLRLS